MDTSEVTTGMASSRQGKGVQEGSRQRRGGDQSWRGVGRKAATSGLNNLAVYRGLIYPMGLEVRKIECMPGCWCRESKANGRA